jgi:hypothetical protein
MSDSAQHLELVRSIVSFVAVNFSPTKFAILTDLPGSVDKPPKIHGFVPDVFAQDAPRTTVIIGEAKTISDLQTVHSQMQVEAFLRFLAAQENGIFILAVPWPVAVTARQIAERYLESLEVKHVKLVICDGQQAGAAANHTE